MYNVDKEFILEAHKVACSEWKEKLEKKFPDIFDDGLAIPKNKIKKAEIVAPQLMKDLGLSEFAIQMLDGAAKDPNTRGRGFYLSSKYIWKLQEAIDGYTLIPYKK